MSDKPATRFHLNRTETRVGPIALLTIDNGEDWQRPTVFGQTAFESLLALEDELRAPDWAGLVLTGKPLVFAAGADLDEFPKLTDRDRARHAGEIGHRAFGILAELPYPTLAAINGACVGGGLEIALHCDYRTVSPSVRHIGFPEVFLNIVPGWGGTQLAPRLLGAAKAIQLIVSNPLDQNRLIDGRAAVELGLADALVEATCFLDDSLAWLVERIGAGAGKRPGEADLADAAELCGKARRKVDDKVHGAAPAPYRALDLIALAATSTLAEGMRAEEEALAELLPGHQAQAAVYAYDLVERRAKRGVGVPDVTPRAIQRVGIVGAGLMATQLATLFLRRLEIPVVLTDVEPGRTEAAVEAIRVDLAKQAAKGRLPESKARFLGTLATPGSDTTAYSGCDLVLEAVFEDLAAKQQVFGQVEAVVSETCILATNTSSLSVADMGAPLTHPERLAGLHFFNPVAILPLVEIVRTPATDDVTAATAWQVVKALGKRGVLVADAPAFVVNRLLTRMTSVLMGALERGNSLEETDAAALRLGLPMPPSALLALVGPRVANHVLHTLHDAFPERFPLSPTLDRLAEGEFEIVAREHSPRTVEQLHGDVLEALADECRRMLDEDVVGTAADIDTCLLLGAGWPFHLGGITKHLDQTGVSERVTGGRLAA